MTLSIVTVDSNNEKIRKDLIAYLAPNETKALFLLGNLKANFQPSFLYVAHQEDRLWGVAGYYPTFNSCTIYSESEEAARGLAQKLLDHHHLSALMGMKTMVEPALDEFQKRGMKPQNLPEKLFFELEIANLKPHFPKEGVIRLIEQKDVDSVVPLIRELHHIPKEVPITDNERAMILASPVSFCLEVEGEVVSIASTNGLALKAFQILGVVTHPLFRKRGYAKALCTHLILFMKKQGATKAILFTGEENVAAQKCYLDLGFQIRDKYLFARF